jgi:hypothetical protein
MTKSWLKCGVLLLPVALGIGCASSGSSSSSSSDSSSAPPATEPAKAPIPPDSIFAKVKQGMSYQEVVATIGQPTNVNSYITGKSFIPFHYGGDNARMAAHYKGVGIVTFSQNNAFSSEYDVISVDYDPTEPGFDRSK